MHAGFEQDGWVVAKALRSALVSISSILKCYSLDLVIYNPVYPSQQFTSTRQALFIGQRGGQLPSSNHIASTLTWGRVQQTNKSALTFLRGMILSRCCGCV